MKGQIFSFFIVCCFFIFHPKLSTAQDHIKLRIEKIADQISGHIGVYALLLETGESISFHGDERFPMQSVYKFPIGMAVLDRIDKGKLSLGQGIHVDTSEYISENGHSPLRDKFPSGVTITVDQLLRYSVEESDGTASDVLLGLLGGTGIAEAYVHGLGIADIAIATTEKIQVANDTIQYRNWATPRAMSRLFGVFYTGRVLSPGSKALLMQYMSPSSPWFDRRIKGLLPPGTPVFHKTGTAGTFNGLTRATNDAGIITLPDGNHLVLSVFISDSYASQKDRELAIAKIAKYVFDYFVKAPQSGKF